jgi:hypothetical protein
MMPSNKRYDAGRKQYGDLPNPYRLAEIFGSWADVAEWADLELSNSALGAVAWHAREPIHIPPPGRDYIEDGWREKFNDGAFVVMERTREIRRWNPVAEAYEQIGQRIVYEIR